MAAAAGQHGRMRLVRARKVGMPGAVCLRRNSARDSDKGHATCKKRTFMHV